MKTQSISVLNPDLRDRAQAITETAIPYTLYRVARAIRRAKDVAFERDLGLSPADWRILISIGASAPLSTKALADHVNMEKPTVSRTTASLVQRGLVARSINSKDQRLIILRLTPRGRIACEAVVRSIETWDAELLQTLSASQVDILRSVLTLLPERLATLDESGLFRVGMAPARRRQAQQDDERAR